MQRKLQNAVRLICILAGAVILFYPSLSTYLSEKNGSQAAGSYDGAVEQQDEAQRQAMMQKAVDYNRALAEENDTGLPLTDEQGKPVCRDDYWKMLNLSENGMMGYIVLPALDETIPIYHSTEEAVLQVGIGHVVNTSLPVGGPSTHAALSGHRGLPSASLFTNLDQLEAGDHFYIHILDQVLAYQVDQILVVKPDDTEPLAIAEGKDYVTLITCTPYGVNSHRLLVRGTRVPYTPSKDGAALVCQEEGSGLAKIPMQYRHLMLGLLAILAFVLLRKLAGILFEFFRKGRG